MKSRAHYEKLFSSFPDVVTLPEFQSMLGGIGDSTARKIMRANKVKHFYIISYSTMWMNTVNGTRRQNPRGSL